MNNRFMRLFEIIGDPQRGISGVIPCSRATFYRNIGRGIYPKPVRICGISYWKKSEIEGVINSI
jgi:predicted DNA-binding transcriptional regulator AlpA